MANINAKERQSVEQAVNSIDPQLDMSAFSNIRSILIVDEDHDVLKQLSQSFAICAKQHDISIARNGRDALKVLKISSVDILLTDLNLSIELGFDLIDYTRKYYPHIRIFAMSEEDTTAIKKRLDDSSINGYIRKPFKIEMIYSVLRI